MLTRTLTAVREHPGRWALRWGLPLLICLGGLLVMVLGGFELSALEGGSYIIGAGLSALLLGWLFRVGFTSDRDRDDESAARDFYMRHGHWPDEPPPAARRPRR